MFGGVGAHSLCMLGPGASTDLPTGPPRLSYTHGATPIWMPQVD